MSLPASYTESTLTSFLETELTPVLAPLGLDASDAIAEAVNEVQGLLGHAVSEEDTVSGVMKVRALARWQAWLAAWNAASLNTDIGAGSASIKDSQGFAQIEKLLARYERAALRYPEAAVVLAGGVRRPVVGQLATTAPATPLYPPDPNSPAYGGRPAGWWP